MFITDRPATKRHLQSVFTAIIVFSLLVIPLAHGEATSTKSIAENSLPGLMPVPQQPHTAQSVELLGQIGGAAQAIQVRAPYAYAGFGTEFDILDISNPAQIQRVGWLATAGVVMDISIYGDFAFIAYRGELKGNYGPTGLQVVDIRHPDIPVSLINLKFSDCGSSPYVIASGPTAFFAYTACSAYGGIIQNAGAYLNRLDISDPTNPIVLAEFSTPMSSIGGLAVRNNQVYAILDSPSATLKVFDTSLPAGLVETGSTPVSGQSQGIALAGSYAFLAAGADGLQVVDVSGPGDPVPAITYTLASEAQVIQIESLSAYIGTNASQILRVDITNPLIPAVTGAYTTTGQTTDIDIFGATGYLANGAFGLEMLDINALAQRDLFSNPRTVNEVVSAYPYAYLAADDGFWVLDVSNPRMPALQAHLVTPQPAVSLVLKGGYAYVALQNEGLWILDISSPALPIKAGAFVLPIELKQLTRIDNTLYAAAGTAGLRILDISSPLSPQQTGAYTPAYGIIDIAAVGTMLYLAADNGNLVMVDASNPAVPEELGIYDPLDRYSGGQSATSVAVQNNIAFLTTVEPPPTPLAGFFSGDVWLIDVTNPAAPTLAHRISNEFGWAPWSISLENKRASIVYQRQGLRIYDFTDSAAPVEIGSYDPPEYMHGVTHSGDRIFFFGDNIYLARTIDPSLPSISGWVIQPNHQPKPGVRVSTGDPLFENITNLQGAFSLRSLPAGAYTFTPSLAGYVFTPSSRTVTLPPSAEQQNFTILAAPVSGVFTPGTDLALVYTDTQGLPTRLEIPGSALATAATVGLAPGDAGGAPGHSFTGHAFELTVLPGAARAADFTFSTPVTLTIQYSADDIQVVTDAQSLALWRWDGAAWQEASQSCSPASEYTRDAAQRVLALPVCQSGVYKLVGDTYQVILPIIVRDK